MSVYGKTKEELLEEENNLSFTHFTYEDAAVLFDFLRSKINEPKNGFKPMGIEIVMNGMPVYSYYQYGATKSSIAWIKGKRKTVEYFGLSAAYVDVWAKETGEEIFCSRYGLNTEFRVCGGGFPIIVKGLGMIGIVAVTGLTRQEDHQICVAGLTHVKFFQSPESK